MIGIRNALIIACLVICIALMTILKMRMDLIHVGCNHKYASRSASPPSQKPFQSFEADTLELQALVDATTPGGILTLTRDYHIIDTIYVTEAISIVGAAPNALPPYFPLTAVRGTYKNRMVKLEGGKNVPVFLVGSKAKLDNLCGNSDMSSLYPQGEYDFQGPAQFKSLHIVGNNQCGIYASSGWPVLCSSSIVDAPVPDAGLKARLAGLSRFQGKSAQWPTTGSCLSASYIDSGADACPSSCSANPGCPIDQQLLSEHDQNHDVWSYVCDDTDTIGGAPCEPSASRCGIGYSYKLDGFKASVVQVVHSRCVFFNCCIERGRSAGVGAVLHSSISINNCFLTLNRWDGYGPDQLQAGYMFSTLTEANGGAGLSMSKGDPTVFNEPMCFSNCTFADGVFFNHYTNLTFNSCSISQLTIGNLSSATSAVGESALFMYCGIEDSSQVAGGLKPYGKTPSGSSSSHQFVALHNASFETNAC
jgi:hypothetical protein